MSIVYNTSIVTSNLIGYWDFKNAKCYPRSGTTVFDLTPTNTNGTLTGSPTYNADGSFSFNGSNWIDLGKNCTTLGISSYATFDVWVYQNGTNAIYGISDYGTNGIGMTLRTNSNASTDFYIYPNNYRITYTYTFNNNTWYNLVGVAAGTMMYSYLNGQQVGSTTLGNGIGTSSNTLKIGVRGDTAINGIGNVGSVKIYNRALTSVEILQNFNALRGRYGI